MGGSASSSSSSNQTTQTYNTATEAGGYSIVGTGNKVTTLDARTVKETADALEGGFKKFADRTYNVADSALTVYQDLADEAFYRYDRIAEGMAELVDGVTLEAFDKYDSLTGKTLDTVEVVTELGWDNAQAIVDKQIAALADFGTRMQAGDELLAERVTLAVIAMAGIVLFVFAWRK